MTRAERAVQIWPLLAYCAGQRNILTYDLLGSLIGVPPQGLGQLLGPIQGYCLLRRLPALTSIVVSETSGLPGVGFIAAEDFPRAQAEVFAHDWLSEAAPGVDDFEQALEREHAG